MGSEAREGGRGRGLVVVGRAVTKDNGSEPVRASARGSELNALQE